jgi:hypothetical protein
VKWEYLIALCNCETKKTGSMFNKKLEAELILTYKDGSDLLPDGLEKLGKLGWELTAVQQTSQHYGGVEPNEEALQFIYIFKRPFGK